MKITDITDFFRVERGIRDVVVLGVRTYLFA
jgi:hypothetical protein